MKKKILIGAIALASATTLVLAHGGANDGDGNQMMSNSQMMQNINRQGMQSQGIMNRQGYANKRMRSQRMGMQQNMGQMGMMNRGGMMNMMQNMRQMHTRMMGAMLQRLNLSSKQQESIKAIMQKNMQNQDAIFEAFKNNNFNKNKFIKIMESKRDNMIKSRAQMLSDIFKVLNKQQKEDFITLIKAKHIMMR